MPFNFSWLVPGRVAGMARPYADAANWLGEQGVTAVVSLTLSPPSDLGEFTLLHAPVPDMTPPSLDQLLRIVGFMQQTVEEGGSVAVHCTAGMGRTGTILAAYLVANGSGSGTAIAEVRAQRPGSIETPAQEEVVRRFAELMGAGSA
ncbi:MAG: phosphatase domain-containing protein [Planctomycetota bacterium]|jgi:atypical dual specificity phosphatase